MMLMHLSVNKMFVFPHRKCLKLSYWFDQNAPPAFFLILIADSSADKETSPYANVNIDEKPEIEITDVGPSADNEITYANVTIIGEQEKNSSMLYRSSSD